MRGVQLRASKRAKRYDVLRRVCREWREAGVYDERLLHDEVEIMERFAPQEALVLIEREITKHPQDLLLRLRLSCVALKLDRTELVSRDPDSYPNPQNVGAQNGAVVINVLKDVEAFDAALRYSYTLLRHNQDDNIAHLALAFLVLSGHPEDLLKAPEVVGTDTAVCFVEEGSAEMHWRVIEYKSHEPQFPEEISQDHEFALRLSGLHLGDTFYISGDEIDGRKATVREIVSKYVYRARKCMNDWQINFPGHPGFEMFRVSLGAGDNNIPDIMPIVPGAWPQPKH